MKTSLNLGKDPITAHRSQINIWLFLVVNFSMILMIYGSSICRPIIGNKFSSITKARNQKVENSHHHLNTKTRCMQLVGARINMNVLMISSMLISRSLLRLRILRIFNGRNLILVIRMLSKDGGMQLVLKIRRLMSLVEGIPTRIFRILYKSTLLPANAHKLN